MEVLADALHESPAQSVHSSQGSGPPRESTQHISSLELENRLLRNEVASLNTEMASLLQRSKEAQTELENAKMKVNKSNSENDQVVRELRARENDLTEALAAKDSQLAILRVRLEEADNSVTSMKQQIGGLQTQRERILQDHTDSSGMHSQALDSLKDRLTEVEAALKREQEAYKKAQQEASERQSKLEQEQQTLAEALTQAERRASEEKSKTTEAFNQVKMAKLNLETARQELTDYKEKAARILQSKERLIASLREGPGASGASGGVSSIEYDSVKQERDMFREELQQSKMTIETLRVELQDIEGQLQQESYTSSEHIQSLEENLGEEKRRREDSEQELLKQKQELQYAIDEINKQKTAFTSQLSSRESEIEKLRNQLTTKSLSSVTESELESRVRALTESLIQKQTVLESLSTEKNSLSLQLERLEQQYRDVEISSARSATTSVSMNDDDDVRQRVPIFMKEAASDTEVTRRVKRAANGIDRFSIRLGVFLRRYPIARVFVIVYMGLLHLWVMIVLLTYQPEIHHQTKQPHEP
ncbi:golgin subfamily A member 5 [Patella vulgata]|uniref:golgin subfamily A member 5 n=1 Tax=Patella vulgata TaxID=6465 RepID=UPI00217FB74A|nr:golgin subfamily A member 5 [Patella vulgata]